MALRWEPGLFAGLIRLIENSLMSGQFILFSSTRYDFTLLNTEIHLPSFIWTTEVWIPPQPSGSSKSPWLIFSPVITPPSKPHIRIYNKHSIPKQADESYPNLNHSLYHCFSTCSSSWKQVTGGYRRLQPSLLGTMLSHRCFTAASKQGTLKGDNDEQQHRLQAR